MTVPMPTCVTGTEMYASAPLTVGAGVPHW